MRLGVTRIFQLILIAFVHSANSQAQEPPAGSLRWPFTISQPEAVQAGYGDWCPIDPGVGDPEGPHPGIDIGCDANEAPYTPIEGDPVYSLGIYPETGSPYQYNGYQVAFSDYLYDGCNWGWGYGHLAMEDPLPFCYGREFPDDLPLDCGIFPQAYTHVHVSWVESLDQLHGQQQQHPEPPYIGYFNPFNYFPDEDLVNYDKVAFGAVPYEAGVSHADGVWFSPDGTESESQFNLSGMSASEYQDIVFGQVDASVRPYSAFGGLLWNEECGINTLGYRVLWENPYKHKYDEVSEYFQTQRHVVEMADTELEYGDSPEFRALFLDGNTLSGGDEEWWNLCTAYILTNTGNEELGRNVNPGWENIWTPEYNREDDWGDQEFCRGAWDTRLGFTQEYHEAPISALSAFPDGRYAFEVKALSQGTAFLRDPQQRWSSRILPANDISNPDAGIKGVIVDNHRPYVDSVIVYSRKPDYSVYYAGGWTYIDPQEDLEFNSTIEGYLPIGHAVADGNSDLWVAVRYSEPMTVDNNDIWITAEMEGEVTWDSREHGKFKAESIDSWPSEHGELDQGRMAGGVWYLYRYARPNIVIEEYSGRLSLHIDHSTSTPVDLAGNALDGNPATSALARVQSGFWDPLGGYEEEDDCYTWGEPTWGTETIDGHLCFVAYVGDQCVFAVRTEVVFPEWDIASMETTIHGESNSSFPGFGEASPNMPVNIHDWEWEYFTEPCPYHCGCWVSQQKQVLLGTTWCITWWKIAVLRPDYEDPVVCTYWLTEGQPLNYSGGPPEYWPYYVDSSWWNWMSPLEEEWDSRYFWLRRRVGSGLHPSPARFSREHWICIDALTGEKMHSCCLTQLGLSESSEFWWTEPTPPDLLEFYYINCNNQDPVYTEQGDWIVPVWYVEFMEEELVYMGDAVFSPPGQGTRSHVPGSMVQRIDAIEETVLPEHAPYITVASPSSEHVDVLVHNASGEEYTLLVYDSLGRIMQSDQGTIQSSFNSISIDAGELPSGLYFVTMSLAGEHYRQQCVVINSN